MPKCPEKSTYFSKHNSNLKFVPSRVILWARFWLALPEYIGWRKDGRISFLSNAPNQSAAILWLQRVRKSWERSQLSQTAPKELSLGHGFDFFASIELPKKECWLFLLKSVARVDSQSALSIESGRVAPFTGIMSQTLCWCK